MNRWRPHGARSPWAASARPVLRVLEERTMTHAISDIAFTPAVKQAQQDRGSRGMYAKVEPKRNFERVRATSLGRPL